MRNDRQTGMDRLGRHDRNEADRQTGMDRLGRHAKR